ncbi:aldo-keto reductase family 1 member A1-like isoform X2 [Zophobas morio]|uniref:aldo-keto reductase family 1 member A1-like isoform X2 n=1 Tax=Zophobas morio TaxID=2755281 RepID=UPI003083245F
MIAKPILTLPSGQKMPGIGVGTFDTNEETGAAVNAALELGYRHIDTAFVYDSENDIGRVLKEWISSGKLKREDLFITTKLPMVGVHPDRVEIFIKKSLKSLQLDYVDLYLIHFPVGCKVKEGTGQPYLDENGETAVEPKTDHVALWKKMEEQVDAGRTKNIGLSNYNISQITTVLKSARIKPACLQIELHVYLQQSELVEFCKKNGIAVVAFSPLVSPSFNDFLTRIGQKPKELPNLLGDPEVAKIAQKHSKSPAQIVLRFLVQIGVAPIPKSVIRQQLEDNINIFNFNLDETDMKILRGLNKGEAGRIATFDLFKGVDKHPDFPFPKA